MFNAGAASAETMLASISLAATCYEFRVDFPLPAKQCVQ